MKISFFVFIGLALFSLSFSVIGEETFYEQVTSISETLRNSALAISVNSAGKDCPSMSHSIIRGADKDGSVYITVRCRGGGDYMMIEGGGATGRILSCAQANAISASLNLENNCWMPLNDPLLPN